MAAAPPSVVGVPPNFDDTGSHGVTPPRRLQPEDGGDYGQPAEGGGSLAINHANEVARVLRDEMAALRATVEANLGAMKRDYDVRLSGRDFTGTLKMMGDKIINLEHEISHVKNDWLETITPRVAKLEEDSKDITQIIKFNEKFTDVKETMNTIENIEKNTKEMINTIEAKLKEDFNLDTENLNVRINDVIDRIGEIQNNINERVSTTLPNTGEDKILDMMKDYTTMNANFQEAIMKSLKDNELEKHKREKGRPRSQRRRQGETRENE